MNANILNKLQREFTSVYEKETDVIFRFCLIRVSLREQALDIVQETFARLWQSMYKGAKIDNVRAFLFTVAGHLVIDWYRKKKPVSLDGLSDEADGEPYEPADTEAHDRLELSAEGRYLLQKFNLVKPINREALYLRFVEGMSPPEIGKIIGLSANAASVRVNRGLEELRKLTGYDRTSRQEVRTAVSPARA